MRPFLATVLFLSFIMSLNSIAAPSAKAGAAVSAYYAQQLLWQTFLFENKKMFPHRAFNKDDCRPNYPQACVEAICTQLSRFDCDDRSELFEIARQCRNVKGGCITTVCGKLGRFDCDDKTELYGIAEMCRGLLDVGCIDYVCSRLSKFDCDDISEIREIVYQCK